MKCSPCSETASSNSIQPRSGRLDASTVDVPTVTAHALIAGRFARAAQEERKLLAVPVADQAQQRRPRREHTRRRQRVLADPADLLAGRDTGKLHARQGLLLCLLAQEPDRAEREHHDRGEQQPADGERERALERLATRRQSPEAVDPVAQQLLHRFSPHACPPATRRRS